MSKRREKGGSGGLRRIFLIKHLMTSLKKYYYTIYSHSIRVAKLTYLVSKKLGLPKEEQIYNCKGDYFTISEKF